MKQAIYILHNVHNSTVVGRGGGGSERNQNPAVLHQNIQ